MQRLIHALLDYSRIGRTGDAEPTDLGALLDTVLADLATRIAETGAVVEAGPLPTLEVHRAEFSQLLLNLLSNALKFARPGVTPRVRAEAEPSANGWTVRVRDNGISLDMRFKDKIFRMFQRLHSRSVYDGTGIGLAHCKKIVGLHGGRVDVTSTPGQGSTFSFTIPLPPNQEPTP